MRRACAVLAAAWLVAGCGHDAVAPEPIPPPPPPIVEEMFPAPRSEQIYYRTAIWVRFAEPLDPSTIDDHTVFFKVDTRRIPADIAWDAASRRIVITPHDQLELLRTHTVLLTTAIRTALGVPLEQDVSWQFRTMGGRIPTPQSPPQGVAGKGPWTTLTWEGTEPEAGSIYYRIYAGPDSAVVASRSNLIALTRNPLYPPSPGWPLGGTVYWTVSAFNENTGEVVDGPVGRFDTLPIGTPIDSVGVPPSEWGYFNPALPNSHPCFGDLVPSTVNVTATRYPLAALAGFELAAARIDANTAVANWPILSSANASIWAARDQWFPCAINSSFPTPDPDVGQLSPASVLLPGRLRFDSPAFIAYIQRVLPTRPTLELMMRSDRTITVTWGGGNNDGTLRVSYYRTPPAANARGGAAGVVATRPRAQATIGAAHRR